MIRHRGHRPNRPVLWLLGCGILLGVLLGLSLRDIIRESYENGRVGALLGRRATPGAAAAPPLASGRSSPGFACCSSEQTDYEIGYSYASAIGIEQVERCESLPPALVRGCVDYARAPRAAPSPGVGAGAPERDRP